MTPDAQSRDAVPARVDPIRAGLLCRCPQCGRGRLYSGFLKVVETCAVCGFDFRRLNTGDGPAVFVMQVAGGVVVFSALGVELAYSPPMWVHLVLWLPLVAVLALGLMRPAKGLMIGLQARNRAAEVRNDEF
ncbi:MAG: DUF983 domain-containing protein [Caulobacterales bacterium]|nr:DUF983 domain-containing protein [Caulobacterales bacterium]